jgi:hypothetical protein
MSDLVIPDAIMDRHDTYKWNTFLNYDTTSCAGMTAVCLFTGQFGKVKVLRSKIGFCGPDSRTL